MSAILLPGRCLTPAPLFPMLTVLGRSLEACRPGECANYLRHYGYSKFILSIGANSKSSWRAHRPLKVVA
jgi:hypothetical protein